MRAVRRGVIVSRGRRIRGATATVTARFQVGVLAAAYGTFAYRLVEIAPPEEAVERVVK
jgi:hypothetical protein